MTTSLDRLDMLELMLFRFWSERSEEEKGDGVICH